MTGAGDALYLPLMTASTTTPDTAAGTVSVSTADGIATVSFHHPKGNSLPSASMVRPAYAVAVSE